MTALEYLRSNIEDSNIPKEHYEWEIADMMQGYAYEYHQKQLILSSVSNCADLKHELEATDKLLNERQRVLDAIPECQSHGKCVPHAIEWIEEMKAKHCC